MPFVGAISHALRIATIKNSLINDRAGWSIGRYSAYRKGRSWNALELCLRGAVSGRAKWQLLETAIKYAGNCAWMERSVGGTVPSKTQSVGHEAETMAADFLQDQGYRIINRNWRCRWGELDLIAQEGETLVFIEVKARSSHDFGSPEESLTRTKQRKLLKAAWQYLQSANMLESEWRFDLIAIDLNSDREASGIHHYRHAIEDLEA